jgi:predicted MPP superfamily phosphohydrolase
MNSLLNAQEGQILSVILSVGLHAATGFGLFLILLNRRLMLLPDSRFKPYFIVLVFLVLTGGAGAWGSTLPAGPWMLAAGVVLGTIGYGEGRRLRIRRHCAGAPPVGTRPRRVSLLRPFTTTDLRVHRYEVTLPGWSGGDLRIALLTDFHVHPSLPREFYQSAFAEAERMRADLTFLTGDFVSRCQFIPLLRGILRPAARHGTYAVMGNHDYWTDVEQIRGIAREAGIRLLTNESVELKVKGGRLVLSGFDYPWGPGDETPPEGREGIPHIVLSHTPDNIYRLSEAGADLVFSGHNHAGQWCVPWLGSLVVPSVYGRRFDHGHFMVNGTHLFVASGVGCGLPPVRIYCPPDIFVVDIRGNRVRNKAAATRKRPEKQTKRELYTIEA